MPRNKAYLEGTSLTWDDLSGVALAKTEGNAADGRLPSHSLGEGWFFISQQKKKDAPLRRVYAARQREGALKKSAFDFG
jgi:hypothetical protein